MVDTRENARGIYGRRGPMVAQSVVVVVAAVWGLLPSAFSLSLPRLFAWLPWVVMIAAALSVFMWSLLAGPREQVVESEPAPVPTTQPPEPRPENRGYFDDLTGLPSRPWLDYAIRNEIARTKRYKHPLSQIMLDIDGFQRINQEHGRANGDYVLMSIADLLRAQVRVSDQVARISADEFVILVPETDIEGAKIVGQKIRRAVELFPFDEGIEVTVSVGITSAVENDIPERFMARTEKAIMAAKQRGGNVCIIAKA